MSRHSISTVSVSSSAEGTPIGPQLRGRLRLTGLALWSALGIGTWLVGAVLVLGTSRARRAIRRRVFGTWARGVERLLGIEVELQGPIPTPPFILVANHLSYLDIVLLASRLNAVFVAKREVRGWPVIGLLTAAMDTIFIDRSAPRDAMRTMPQLGSALAAGDGVVLFLEATSSEGAEVLPFRPALLEWAARNRQPVHHASLSYSTPPGSEPAHLAVCWWGDMTFGAHLMALAELPRIQARLALGEQPIQEADRRRLAELLHHAVRERFVPVVIKF